MHIHTVLLLNNCDGHDFTQVEYFYTACLFVEAVIALAIIVFLYNIALDNCDTNVCENISARKQRGSFEVATNFIQPTSSQKLRSLTLARVRFFLSSMDTLTSCCLPWMGGCLPIVGGEVPMRANCRGSKWHESTAHRLFIWQGKISEVPRHSTIRIDKNQ